jgi:hypothetical protein
MPSSGDQNFAANGRQGAMCAQTDHGRQRDAA